MLSGEGQGPGDVSAVQSRAVVTDDSDLIRAVEGESLALLKINMLWMLTFISSVSRAVRVGCRVYASCFEDRPQSERCGVCYMPL